MAIHFDLRGVGSLRRFKFATITSTAAVFFFLSGVNANAMPPGGGESGLDAMSFETPQVKNIDENGVELSEAVYNRSDILISIGDETGIKWVYSGQKNLDRYGLRDVFFGRILSYDTYFKSNAPSGHGYTCCTAIGGNGWYSSIGGTYTSGGGVQYRKRPKTYKLKIGSEEIIFYKSKIDPGLFVEAAHTGSTLTNSNGKWYYNNRNGVEHTFFNLVIPDASATQIFEGALESVKYPDGKFFSIHYDVDNSCLSGCNVANSGRISRVVYNNGYGLKYTYRGDSFYDLYRIYAINISESYCNSEFSNPECVSDNYIEFSVPDSTDSVYIYNRYGQYVGYRSNNNNIYDRDVISYFRTASGREINIDYDIYGRVTKFQNAIGDWEYRYSDQSGYEIQNANGRRIIILNSDAVASEYNINKNMGTVSSYKNANGFTESYGHMQYDTNQDLSFPYVRLLLKTFPEGNSIGFEYDARGNVTRVASNPKAGSGVTILIETAGYPLDCPNPKICNKPLWVRDAKGQQTDYEYSADHGGVTLERAPADAAGVRRETRYEYTPLYAKIKDANGNLVNAEGPIYKLTKVWTCATAASCPGSANEQVKEYAYNHNNLLLTSETVRAGDNSVSATTSYTYDYVGNVTSVDGPRTDVDDRSYTTWDVLRRKVFEIGPDPDGGGPLKRQIVKHYYDADSLEIRTEVGSGNNTDGSDFVWSSAKRMTYDDAAQLVKTEVVVP